MKCKISELAPGLVIFRLFMDKLRRSWWKESCRIDTVPTTLTVSFAKVAYVRCCRRRTDDRVTTFLFYWHCMYATVQLRAVVPESLPTPWLNQHDVVSDRSLTSRLRQRTVVSHTSPTTRSPGATSRLIAPSATASMLARRYDDKLVPTPGASDAAWLRCIFLVGC